MYKTGKLITNTQMEEVLRTVNHAEWLSPHFMVDLATNIKFFETAASHSWQFKQRFLPSQKEGDDFYYWK